MLKVSQFLRKYCRLKKYPDRNRGVIIVRREKRIKDCLSVYWLWWTEHDHGIYKPQRLSYQTNGHYLTLIDREIVSIITWLIQTFTTSITINIYRILSSWWKTLFNNFVDPYPRYEEMLSMLVCWSRSGDLFNIVTQQGDVMSRW